MGTDFRASIDSTVNITGGSVGDEFAASVDSVVNISGGTVGNFSSASEGSQVNISGNATVGDNFEVFGFGDARGVVNISGGSVGDDLTASGGIINISGGSVGDNFVATDFAGTGSTVNISGGSVGEGFLATAESEINFFGSQFFLNGELLDTLEIDELFGINEPISTLSGILTDGSSFSFGPGTFESGSTVTVTLVAVPEPTSALLLGGLGVLLSIRRRRSVATV